MSKTIRVKERYLEHVCGAIAESLEIIDAMYGNSRTYYELEKDGLVVDDLKLFMQEFKQYIPVTQAMFNRKLEEDARKEQDEKNGILDVELVD